MPKIKLTILPLQLNPKRSRWPLLIGLLFLLIAIPAAFYFTSRSTEVEASWWNAGWAYRKKVEITNTTGTALTDYQLSFSLDTASLISDGKLQSDCDDIRIINNNGQTPPFWIEEGNGCNSSTTRVWTKVPVLPATNGNIYVYYGNSSASRSVDHDGKKVFVYFEDFSGNDLPSNINATGSYSISAGELSVTTGAVYSTTPIQTGTQNYLFEYRHRLTGSASGYAGMSISDENHVHGSNSGGNAVILYISTGYNRTTYSGDGTVNSYNINNGSNQYTASVDTYYIDGFGISPSQVKYYNNRSLTNSYNGTFNENPHLILGYFTGADAGTSNNTDIVIDWVISRKLASSEPNINLSTEQLTPGPAGHWKLDEGSGQLKDSTAHGNNSTTMTAVWADASECISGKCLRFSQSSHQVIIPDSKILSATEGVTIQGWFNATSTAAETGQTFLGMIQKDGGYSGFGGYGFRQISDGRVQAMIARSNASGDGVSMYSQTYLEKNKWYFISMTYDYATTTWRIYINGKLDRESTFAYTDLIYDSPDPFRIGRGDSRYFHGLIDEVKVYPYARTPEQVLNDYNLGAAVAIGHKQQSFMTEGLVGYWKMDETSTPTLDSFGNNNSLNWQRNVSSSIGKYSTGMIFDGLGDYAEATTDVLDVGTGSVSLTTWIKASNTPAQPFIIDNRATWGGTSAGITLSTTSGNHYPSIRLADGTIGPFEFAGTSSVLDDEWHHIVGIIDRDQNKVFIYVDGQLQGNYDLDTNLDSLTSSSGMRLGLKGTADSTTNALNGTLDEVRIYNRALKPEEVRQLYQYAPGPVGYWKFDEGGTTAADSSGNGYTASLVNTPVWEAGKYGSSLNFNDTSDYLTVDNVPIGDHDWTISA